MNQQFDAIIIGSGPNGLAAAITLAREGLSVVVLEADSKAGGAVRSDALTLPGFVHDSCSSIYPFALASPFFRSLNLDVEWVHPGVPLAHPLDEGRAAWLDRSVALSAECLGRDAESYRSVMGPFVNQWEPLVEEILQPLLHWPKHPFLMAGFGRLALRSAAGLARQLFKGEGGQALLAGVAGHSLVPLRNAGSAAIALVLAVLAHAAGWPFPKGGAGKIADGFAAKLRALGGRIETNFRVTNLDELPRARATFFDVTPRQLLAMAGRRLPAGYRAALNRYQYGPGVFKVDYALNAPIPWTAQACGKAGTVHLGGTLEEIELSEQQAALGKIAEKPFVLLAQHSLFDNSRAPEGKHTAWAYCHVPHGSEEDMTGRIESQIERFAPGFRDCVLARWTQNCRQLQQRNSNLIGGDINGGLATLRQLAARPILSAHPYRIPVPGFYLCSSSTPPGGGVHGMCGFNAARDALENFF